MRVNPALKLCKIGGYLVALVIPFAAMSETTFPARTGVLETIEGVYEFNAPTCAIYHDDGFDDIEIMGPGTAPNGEVFYFEFSSTAGVLSLELGVDSVFKSSDRKFNAGRVHSQPFTIKVVDRLISVSDIVLVDEQSVTVDPDAKMQINCAT